MMTTEEKFKAAVNVIRSLPKHGSYQPSTEMQLKFYSFYKQATEGPCTVSKPSFWDVVGKAKWDAWKNLGNMDREEAMEKYVDELKQIIETMSYTENVAKFIDMLGPFYEVIPLDKASFNGDIENEAEAKGAILAVKGGTGRRINGYGQGEEADSDGDEFSDTYDQVNEARGGGGGELGTSGLNARSTNSSGAASRSVRQRPARDSVGTSAAEATSNPGISGGAGGGREGRGISRTDVSIEEQLALAVIKLQHSVDQVNSRIESLEASMKQLCSNKDSAKGIELLLGISPRVLVLILLWPFIAHWLLHVCRRK